MKVHIVEDFTGYPDGTDASRCLFRKGEEPDLPDGFAELIVAKGHASTLSNSTCEDKIPLDPDNT